MLYKHIYMNSKLQKTKKIEKDKQGENYLSLIYSDKRRPMSNYPLKLAKELIKRDKIKKKSILLDVGCGRGDMLKAFKANEMIVEGVDLSEESINLLSPIKVHQKNLEEEILEGKSKYYDIIFSKSLIEHLKSPLKFIQNCKSLLKDDGCLIILTPSWYHHNFGPFYLDYTHVTPFTLHSLRDIGMLAGFSNVKVEYFYQLPFTWRYSFLKLIPKLISLFNIPYHPMYEDLIPFKLPNKLNTLVRFSREVMLYGVMRK